MCILETCLIVMVIVMTNFVIFHVTKDIICDAFDENIIFGIILCIPAVLIMFLISILGYVYIKECIPYHKISSLYHENFSVNDKEQVIGLSKGNNSTEIEIPSISKGVKENAFMGYKNIEKVTISDGVEVEPRAFIGCSNLKEIVVSSYIPVEAFKFCPNLTTVTVPDIGHSVFVGDYEFLPNGSSVIPEDMRIELSN